MGMRADIWVIEVVVGGDRDAESSGGAAICRQVVVREKKKRERWALRAGGREKRNGST